MSKITDSIKKNYNDFSFISTFFELVGNKEFKKAEISTLYTSAQTKETSLWRSLSAVAEQLGETFYSNVLNFIDNIYNIDTCKINALQSIISAMGLNYTVFSEIQFMPAEVIDLIDKLSIKREYLTCDSVMDKSFISCITSDIIYDDVGEVSCVLADVVDVFTKTKLSSAVDLQLLNKSRQFDCMSDPSLTAYRADIDIISASMIDDDKLNNYISSAFYSLLSSKITQTYNNKTCTYIYEELSTSILCDDFALPNQYSESIEYKRRLFNLPKSFDVEDEVDNYENGLVELSDYSTQELSLMSIEMNRRKDPFKQAELKTRYKYYREREVKEYAEFIQYEYSSMLLSTNYVSNDIYDIDSNYTVLNNAVCTNRFFYVDDKTGKFTFNISMLSGVAVLLQNITSHIRDIRTLTKTQCQKIYFRGTKMLLQYLIQEYLRSNVYKSLKDCQYLSDYVFDVSQNYIDIVEYYDTTNYFNISCSTDSLFADSNDCLNARYWEESCNSDTIAAVDTTNLLDELPSIQTSQYSINAADVSSLYLDMLDCNFSNNQNDSLQTKQLQKFLSTVYAIGADSTFISDGNFYTHDSIAAKDAFDIQSAFHAKILHNIQHNSNVISAANCILSSLDLSTTLQQQLQLILSSAYGFTYAFDINGLSCALAEADELQTAINLSKILFELSDQYTLADAALHEKYENALLNDTYVKQTQLDQFCLDCISNYQQISSAFAAVSNYIPDDLCADSDLRSQISQLCMHLSSLDASKQSSAVHLAETLSIAMQNANELSSIIQLDTILEQLSTKYDMMSSVMQEEIRQIECTDEHKYRQALFYAYSGQQGCNMPYYYLANTRHPSFMVHPYIYNFIEKDDIQYAVDNIQNTDINTGLLELKNSISNYIDEDGYLVNVYDNPLNSNTDYVSRYEQVQHITSSGQKSAIIGYDGMFYPAAVHDFCSNPTEFIKSLSGTIDASGNRTPNENKWYKHLELTLQERDRICSQLCTFYTDINNIAHSEKIDIFRYGLDIYQNAYCLVKRNDINYDYSDTKLSTAGNLWMRIKDHPIAFPAYAYSAKEGNNFMSQSQITIGSNSKNDDNTQIHAFMREKCVILNSANSAKVDNAQPNSQPNSSTIFYPSVIDFMFSADKNMIVIVGRHKNYVAAYPLISEVEQDYVSKLYLNQYYHKRIVNTDIMSIIDETHLSQMDGMTYQMCYEYDNMIGCLYTSITAVKKDDKLSAFQIDIAGSYYKQDFLTSKIIDIQQMTIDEVRSNTVLENVCLDINNGIITLAYLVDAPALSDLSNYICQQLDDDAEANVYAEYSQFVVKTKQYQIANNSFVEYVRLNSYNGNEHMYMPYTDIGFYGLLGNNGGKSNVLSGTYIAQHELKTRGIYKFQMLSKSISSINRMIEFVPTQAVSLRSHEQYKANALTAYTPQGTVFKALDYFDLRFYEPANTSGSQIARFANLSSNNGAYSIGQFKSAMKNSMPIMQVDEENTQQLNTADNRTYFIVDEGSQISKFKNAHADKEDIIDPDNCMFSVSDASDMPLISASWCQYDDAGINKIQLDFNTLYFTYDVNAAGENSQIKDNEYNKKHLFLNLPEAGDAGELYIYKDPLCKDIANPDDANVLIAKCYIKNISDTKPKFLLSVHNEISTTYGSFILQRTDDGISCIVTEDGENNIVSEVSHMFS